MPNLGLADARSSRLRSVSPARPGTSTRRPFARTTAAATTQDIEAAIVHVAKDERRCRVAIRVAKRLGDAEAHARVDLVAHGWHTLTLEVG